MKPTQAHPLPSEGKTLDREMGQVQIVACINVEPDFSIPPPFKQSAQEIQEQFQQSGDF